MTARALSVNPAFVPRTAAAGSDASVDVLVFLVGALVFAEVTLGGRLFASEIILLAVLPLVVLRRWHTTLVPPIPVVLFVLGGLWLWSQVVTDVYRVTPFEDYSRGWLKIAFTLANFVALYFLIENRPRRLALFAAGMAAGRAIDFFVSPGEYAEGDPWKFGVAVPITLGFVLAGCSGRARRVSGGSSVLLGIAAAVNLHYGFRSLAGICLLASAYLLLHDLSRRKQGDVRFSHRRLALLAAVGAVAAVGSMAGYSELARAGKLGSEAAATFRTQQGDNPFDLLTNGRPAVWIATRAISESPIVGYGSWAKDPPLVSEYLAHLARLGLGTHESIRREGLIPTHSHLFGAWVEAGVLGAVFWVWILWLALRVLSVTYRDSYALMPLVAFGGLTLTWDILFSPFGAERRIFVPFYVILLLYAWHRVRPTKSGAGG